MIKSEAYKKLSDLHRREFLRELQSQKIRVLGTYFDQADDFLSEISRIPSFEDENLLMRSLVSLDDRLKVYNQQLLPDFMRSNNVMIKMGFNQQGDYAQLDGLNYSASRDRVLELLDDLRSPLEDNIRVLKNYNVYIAPHTAIEAIVGGRVISSQNRFNAMAELIGRLPEEQQKQAFQALANYIDSSDPLGNATLTAIELSSGVTAKESYRLSNSIWGKDKRDIIYQKIINLAKAGKNKQDIIDELVKYIKESGQGGAYYKAQRIVDTELTRAYTRASLEAVRDMNVQDIGPKMFIEQKLSPFHPYDDVCDKLEGVYDPEGVVPEIPRHPNCICIQNKIFVFDIKDKIKKIEKIDEVTYI